MKHVLVAAGLLIALAGTASAEEGGCLKYGAGGAVAGHFVGQGHGVAGAAAGCAVGAYKRHEARKAQSQAANSKNATDNAQPHSANE